MLEIYLLRPIKLATRLAFAAAGEPLRRHGERLTLRAANDNCRIRLVVDNDNAGRITAYTDSNSAYSQSFGYDANDRLTSWTGGWGISESYSYDANGNRRTVSITGQTLATLVYPTTNNKFTGQGGGNMPFTPSYDATGNMTAINNGITLVYDGRNRVASSTAGGITTNYWVNGLGQRVRKTWNGSTVSHVLFTYAPDGKHVGSYDLNGALTEETIFLGDTPIATVTGAGTFNLYADHINAIRQVTNQTNQTRWSWEQTNAFGSTLPNQNPTGLGTFNYRRGFPGQFYDAELLTWNNGFRTYHAGLGRYLQPDPIGLAGGSFSIYNYVDNDPARFYDPDGFGKTRAVRKVLEWTKHAWNHVKGNHIDNRANPNKAHKSTFCDPCNVKKDADKTINKPDRVIKQDNGRTRYEREYSKDQGVGGEKVQVVVVEPNGKTPVTTFPAPKLSPATPKRITVPLASAGVALFGDNFFGQACDFFNPLSDLQDAIDMAQGNGDEQVHEMEQ